MALGVAKEPFAEIGGQLMGPGIQKGRHELPAIAGVQIYRLLTGHALQLVHYQLQGMPAAVRTRCQGIRPEGRDHHDATARQAPAQVKQQAGRPCVRPLQVVQCEAKRVLPCQGMQDVGDLFEDVRLLAEVA